MSTISERVQRGAEWLDTERPGWVDRINLDIFDMAEGCKCVIGQLSPHDFDTAIHKVWMGLTYSTAYDLGFFAGPSCVYAVEYLDVTAEWRRVITERRAAA